MRGGTERPLLHPLAKSVGLRGLFSLMGAFAGATLCWIGWGIMTPGDCLGCGAMGGSLVNVTMLTFAVFGGFSAFKGRSGPARIAVTATTAICCVFWLAAPDGWWAKAPRQAPQGGEGLVGPAADELREAHRPSLTTHTRSDTLLTPQERVSFLARYLRLRSAVSDAAFVIDYHDNSTGLVIGPSDWRVWAGLRLPQGTMSLWLVETRPCEQKPDLDLDKILPEAWHVASEARCLQRDGSTLIVHAPEEVLVFFADAH
jgi:hypothetical protein